MRVVYINNLFFGGEFTMKQIQLQKIFRIVNYSFGIALFIVHWLFMDIIIEELNLIVTSNSFRSSSFEEALPPFAAIVFLTLPLIYYERLRKQLIYKFAYFMYVGVATTFFLLFGHYKYIIEYESYEAWTYHVILCFILILWNIVYAVFTHKIDK